MRGVQVVVRMSISPKVLVHFQRLFGRGGIPCLFFFKKHKSANREFVFSGGNGERGVLFFF